MRTLLPIELNLADGFVRTLACAPETEVRLKLGYLKLVSAISHLSENSAPFADEQSALTTTSTPT